MIPLAEFPPVSAEWTFLVVLVVILAGPLIVERLRLPGMIGLLLGGMVVGPTVLDWVEREGAVSGIGQIGLLLLMFMAGLELDLDDFARNRTNAIRFGVLTFAIPLVAGALVGGLGFGYGLGAAVLFGSLWASHTLVAYPIAREHGLGSDRGVAMAVGGTVITDTLALFVLAVVVGAHEGGSGPALVGSLVGGLALLAAVALVVLPRAMRWFFRGPGQDRGLRFVSVLCAFSACAVIAHVVGLEGIVGAFFAGLALNRLVPNRSGLMERLEFFGSSLLIPFFLVSTGMLIDPAAFTDGHTLALAAASLAVVGGGKLAAAWLGGRAAGLTRAQIGMVFSLSVAQAAATLATVIIGFQAGIFGDDLVNSTLVVVLVSLVAATVGASRAAPRIPAEAGDEHGKLGTAVLVPVTDGSTPGRLRLAARLAAADGGVVLPLAIVAEGTDPGALAQARGRLAEAEGVVRGLASESRGVLRIDDSIPAAALHAASEHDASLVVAGLESTLGAWDSLFGTGRVALLEGARTPVLVVAPGAEEPARVVLGVGPHDLDPGRAGELALAVRVATRLAHALDVELTVVSHAAGASRPVLLELERAPVVEYTGTLVAGLEPIVRPTDLVVVPARLARAALSADALRLARLPARPTLVAAALPSGDSVRGAGVLGGRVTA